MFILFSTYFSKEICRRNEYVHGNWIINRLQTQKSFYCCQNDDVGIVDYCGNNEVGKENKFFHHDDLVIAPDKACICDILEGTRHNVSAREEYSWVPEHCLLEKFTGEQFCNLLGKRRILLVGDSLMHQMASVLINILKTLNAPCLNQLSYGRTTHLKFSSGDGNQESAVVFHYEYVW